MNASRKLLTRLHPLHTRKCELYHGDIVLLGRRSSYGGKQTNKLIETHVKRMDDVIVSDVPTARQALAHATAAVAAINQGLIPPQSYESIGDLDPVEEIVNKLEGWITCILDKLDLIVEKLGEGVTFSLSVGTGISVTINFPANQAVPAKSKEPGVSMSQGN